MQKYNFWQSLLKMVVKVGIFAIPVLVAKFPALANITIGGVGYLVVDYLQKKFTTV